MFQQTINLKKTVILNLYTVAEMAAPVKQSREYSILQEINTN